MITCIQGYHAPLDVYHQLNEINEDPGNHELHKMSKINLCVGKEWYRFPSNFFLPERLVLLSSFQMDGKRECIRSYGPLYYLQ